ncbi:hypothetical protein ABPG74_020167 [Tetrahymena malaccensis]
MDITDNQQKKQKVSKKRSSKEKSNWLLYKYFVRKDFGQCMELIEQLNLQNNGTHEYANFLKSLILRNQGELNQSLELQKDLHTYNEQNYDILKQISRSMFLAQKFKASIEVANHAININSSDWQLYYTQGQCFVNLSDYQQALKCFQKANQLSKHESTFLELGKLYTDLKEPEKAIEIYEEALQHSNDNSDILVILGVICLKQQNEQKAFKYLGQALSVNNKDLKAILAASSVMQDKQEYESALMKYKIMAKYNPNSQQLWNNIGMCFYGMKKNIFAIACLKKALYLSPFEWITCLNLGLVYMTSQQYATAYFFFTVSINLRPNYAITYMHLGQCLNRLEDFPNACSAFRKAIEIEKDYLIFLNFAIILAQRGPQYFHEAKENVKLFESKFLEMSEDSRVNRSDVLEQRQYLSNLLGLGLPHVD